MLSKLLVILVCILAVSSEARLHGRRRLSRSGHKIRRLMNQASPRCAAMLMDGCQYQCADQANPQQCTTCVEGNVLTNYDELVRHGCVEPPKMDKCNAIMMDGCMGLCTRGNTPECNECATRNAMNNYAELMENGCINRNRRLFRTADEAPQMCCQSMSPSCVACRKRQERNAWYKRRQEIKNLVRSMNQDPDWSGALEGKDNRRLNGLMDKCSAIMMDGCMGLCTLGNTPECNECATRNVMNNYAELMKNGCINRNRRLFRTADENVGGGRVYGEYEKGPYKAGAEYNWDEQVGISDPMWRPNKGYHWDEAEENVGRGYGKPQFREYFEAGGWRL